MRRRNRISLALLLGLAVGPVGVPAEEPPAPAPGARMPTAGWLGVYLTDAVDGGVQVVVVWPGGPADRAGLRAGDTLVEAAGEPIGDRHDFARAMASRGAGDDFPVTVLRGAEEQHLVVRLGTKGPRAIVPPEPPEPAVVPSVPPIAALATSQGIGLEVETITAALRRHFGAPESVGVLVTRVEPGQAADRAGLRVGDVIVRLGDEDVSSAGEVQVNLMPWKLVQPVPAVVVREQKPVRLELRVATAEAAPTEQATAARQVVRRRIEAEIRRLERRITELKQELEDIDSPD